MIFRYAFASRRSRPDIPPGALAFTIHRQSGVATLFGFLAGVSLMEAALVHLLVARWSVLAAGAITAVNVYGALWLTAIARSFAILPVLVTEDEVILRSGLFWTVHIPRNVLTLEPPGAKYGLRIPQIAEPNFTLRLSQPVTARGIYGISRTVDSIALAVDDPGAFSQSLIRKINGRTSSSGVHCQ